MNLFNLIFGKKEKQKINSVQKPEDKFTSNYGGREIIYSFPPVTGTHEECFQQITKGQSIQPANGFELSLLVQGAFTKNSSKWKFTKEDVMLSNFLRIPMRALWMPEKSDFAGVILETDLEGKGLQEKMDVLTSLSGWKEENGVYISPDKKRIFVPKGKYRLGEHNQYSFMRDGLARGVLTEEGAEIFAKTAYDHKSKPILYGINILPIEKPEQRVIQIDALWDFTRFGLHTDAMKCQGSYAFGIEK